MGICKYCGQPAGLFSNEHVACAELARAEEHRRAEVMSRAAEAVATHLQSGQIGPAGDAALAAMLGSLGVWGDADRRAALALGWSRYVDACLADGVLDPDEERRIVQFAKANDLTRDELDQNGALTRLLQAAVIRDVLHGVIPPTPSNAQNLPVVLQKGEQAIWNFETSQYYEDRTRRQYVGGSSGVSIRVARGVYFRTGAFRGTPVETTERVLVDQGATIVTTKNLYFAGPTKALRIPYAKVVAFTPYTDGVGVIRDAASAKAQVFVTGDGWFIYNLVTNLARL